SPPAVRDGARLRGMSGPNFFPENLYLQISFTRKGRDVMELPSPGMIIDARRTALVITDLQNDFLSPGGIAWGLVADSLAENNTLENLESLLRAARRHGLPVFISPHYYYLTDRTWMSPGGALEALMQRLGVFARTGPLTLDGFAGSGADWPERFKPYI